MPPRAWPRTPSRATASYNPAAYPSTGMAPTTGGVAATNNAYGTLSRCTGLQWFVRQPCDSAIEFLHRGRPVTTGYGANATNGYSYSGQASTGSTVQGYNNYATGATGYGALLRLGTTVTYGAANVGTNSYAGAGTNWNQGATGSTAAAQYPAASTTGSTYGGADGSSLAGGTQDSTSPDGANNTYSSGAASAAPDAADVVGSAYGAPGKRVRRNSHCRRAQRLRQRRRTAASAPASSNPTGYVAGATGYNATGSDYNREHRLQPSSLLLRQWLGEHGRHALRSQPVAMTRQAYRPGGTSDFNRSSSKLALHGTNRRSSLLRGHHARHL